METAKKWLAVYTKPRWEKKIHAKLIDKGISSWCPLHKVERQWTDRKKVINDTLFKSYVFVNVSEDERVKVLQTAGVVRFLFYMGKPAVIRPQEIETIKSFLLEKDAKIHILSLKGFKTNDKVKIRQGVFMDSSGVVVRGNHKKVYVQLESLGQLMVVEFPAGYVMHDDNFINDNIST